MKRIHSSHAIKARQGGLTLVELMIGLVIGLVMTGAISFLFIDASRNYRVTENLSRMQETSRFVLDKIGRDARGAGYYGCAGEEATLDNMLNNASSYLYNFGAAVEAHVAPATGWPTSMSGFGSPTVRDDFDTTNASSQAVTPFPGSHILALRGIPDGDIIVRSQPGGASIKFSNTNAIINGDILLVTTCRNAAVFQVTQVQQPTAQNPFTNVVHNSGGTWVPGNAVQKTDEDLAGGEVMRVATTTYFIANHPYHQRRSLFRRIGANQAVEIGRNVVGMQIFGGLDSDGDRQIESFVPTSDPNWGTSNDWDDVRAIRIQLTLQSEDTGIGPNGGPLTYTTTTTIALRNRLP